MADIPEQENEDDIIRDQQKRDVAEAREANQQIRQKQTGEHGEFAAGAAERARENEEGAQDDKPKSRIQSSLADLADKCAKWTRR